MAGGVLLTLDARLPVQRRRRMIDEARCAMVLDTGAMADDRQWLAEAGIEIISWRQAAPGECTSHISVAEMEDWVSDLDPHDPAYIFFTSGTTGTPKGILGCHRGLSHFLAWQREYFRVGPGDRSAQLTGLSFDVVLRDVFLPLTSGALLCLPDDPEYLGADRILPWLDREQITLLHTVPAIAASWLAEHPDGITLRSLRQIFFAGEPLSDVLVTRWRAAFPLCGQLANLYGPTETSLAKLCYEVPPEAPPGIQPVGWPLPETEALILAPDGRLCGLGEPGEIVIRTPYRSLGYLNPSDDDHRRFRPNHFRQDEYDLLYYTGDRGRYRSDGAVEILGRLDDQVKIRGMRVEPGEVATLLSRHPGVGQCAVLAHEGKDGEKYLAAYVVPGSDAKPTAEEMRAFLAPHVPEYMLPTAFVFIEHIPLTANGKFDRSALPVPSSSLWRTAEFEIPRTPEEIALAEIWSSVLGIAQIGIHDDFFELGGHSLLATRLNWQVRERFNIDLPLRVIFEMPTLAHLAAAIRSAPTRDERRRGASLVPLPRIQQLL